MNQIRVNARVLRAAAVVATLATVAATSVVSQAANSTAAGAGAVTPAPGKVFFWQVGANPTPPSPGDVQNNLLSHGGSVEVKPSVYVVFWGPAWKNGFKMTGTKTADNPKPRTFTNVDAMRYVTRFFQSVGGSTWNAVQTQYCENVPAGTFDCATQKLAQYETNPSKELKGTWVDPSPVPADIITSGLAENVTSDPIAAEALKLADKFGYQKDATYFVLTEPGHIATGYGGGGAPAGAYCAYHSQVTNSDGVPSHGIQYAFIPYIPEAGAGCRAYAGHKADDAFGHGYFDSYSLTIGHEYGEAETDPGNLLGTQDGWNDNQTSENGDKCADGHGYFNMPMGGYSFTMQPMWSNKITGCATTLTQKTPT